MRKLAFVLVFVMFQATQAADIIWVHQMRGGGDGVAGPDAGAGSLSWEDDQWRALIEGQGHTITKHAAFDDLETLSLDDFDGVVAELEAADLVVMSRDSNSGDYNDPIEHEAWTSSFSTPFLIMSPYMLRSSRWDMVESTSIVDAMNSMEPVQPEHPIFDGIELTDGTVEFWSQLGEEDHIDLVEIRNFGFGDVLAVEAETGLPWIAYWDGEQVDGDFYDGSLRFAGGPRLYLSAGSDDDPNTWGEKNVTAAGDQIVLNAITFLTGDAGTPVALPNDCNNDAAVDSGDLSCVLAAGGADALNSLLAETGLIPGDLDGDGTVAFLDFLTIANNFGAMNVSYTEGDVDGNGEVAFGDFLTLANNFGMSSNAAASAVPEPETFPLLVIAAGFLLSVRRRRD